MITFSSYIALRRQVYNILQNRLYETRLSTAIDYFLVTLIMVNVAAVMLESVDRLYYPYQDYFDTFETFSIVIFSIEYLLRLWSMVEENPEITNWKQRVKWFFSIGALIDFIAIIPAFISYYFLIDLRFLRILRLFRIFKLTRYFVALRILLVVFRKELDSFKAVLFIFMVMMVTASSGIYLVENQAQPEVFESIPKSLWWAVVTLTTVGYGDVVPVTLAGKVFGAVITILGVGLAALPAGILASGLATELKQRRERVEQSFKELLLSRNIDLIDNTEEAHRMRLEFGLNEIQAKEIIRQVIREQHYERKLESQKANKYCRHCGEKL